MINFNKFNLSPGIDWKFFEFRSIIIGEHKADGLRLQLSSAYNHPTYYFKEHKDGLFIAKQFASAVDEAINHKVLVDNEYKIGCIDVKKIGKNETYFYTLHKGDATVSVLQGGNNTEEEKSKIASILSTIKYNTVKEVANSNA